VLAPFDISLIAYYASSNSAGERSSGPPGSQFVGRR
jgi:hypothetical protein